MARDPIDHPTPRKDGTTELSPVLQSNQGAPGISVTGCMVDATQALRCCRACTACIFTEGL